MMPDVYLLFMVRGAVQRALRARVVLMDRLGECMRNLVGFIGKAGAWAVQQVFTEEVT